MTRFTRERGFAPDAALIAKALGHPVRVRALRLIRRRDISPQDIALLCDIPLTRTLYHFKVLLECGAIELVGRKPAAGEEGELLYGARWCSGPLGTALDDLLGGGA